MLNPAYALSPQDLAGSQQEPNCALRLMAGLDMQTMPDGRVTVPVQFEGHNHNLMVDTGGYINTVTPQLAKDEGYEIRVSHGTTLRGLGARSLLNTYVDTKEFTIGHSLGKDFAFFVEPFNDLSMDGTLAPSILAAYDVDFDFGHDKLNLFNPDHCPGRVVYWTKGPVSIVPIEIQNRTHIRIPVTIEGKEIMATLDTGSVTSLVTLRALSKFVGLDEKSAGMKSLGNKPVNGLVAPVYNYPFQALAFGGVTVSHPHIE
ncbi:MAG TPA: hypothetical protein VGG66_07940, partial [Rhizomicrobium sp.]